MKTKSFKDIRTQYPDEFLVLVDYESRDLPSGDIEVVGAKYVHVYKSGSEMYEAYRDLTKKGFKAVFVPPHYKNSFVMEKRYSMRIGSIS